MQKYRKYKFEKEAKITSDFMFLTSSIFFYLCSILLKAL
ncbi:putative membrane protein [Cloacibacterium normanense]|uniref:Putative membrane protein n=1 Tax=Cloacibacterium normanense TaxID=237258 RepID=A0A1E5UB87_9FLAO|nr:putative membrane protein [Cloacibacterium normanense]